MSTSSGPKSYEGRETGEADDFHSGKNAVSGPSNAGMRSSKLWAAPNPCGRPHVEVHRSLAAVCILPAG
jgi:hypothetical protein